MLSKHQQQARNQLIAISLDDLVPEDRGPFSKKNR